MSEKVSFKSLCVEWVISLTVMVVLTMACNIVGYGGRFLESIPGMLILCVISFLGLTAKHFIPQQPAGCNLYRNYRNAGRRPCFSRIRSHSLLDR